MAFMASGQRSANSSGSGSNARASSSAARIAAASRCATANTRWRIASISGVEARDARRLGARAGRFLLGLAPLFGLDRRVDGLLDGEQFGGDPLGLGVDPLALRQHGGLDLGAGLFQRAAQAANLGAGRLGGGQAGSGGHVERRGVLLPQQRQRGGGGPILGDVGRLGGGRRSDTRWLARSWSDTRCFARSWSWLRFRAVPGGMGSTGYFFLPFLPVSAVPVSAASPRRRRSRRRRCLASSGRTNAGTSPGWSAAGGSRRFAGRIAFADHLELHGEIALAVGAAGAHAHAGANRFAQQGFALSAGIAGAAPRNYRAIPVLKRIDDSTPSGSTNSHRQPRLQGIAEQLSIDEFRADDFHVQLGAAHRRGTDLEVSRLGNPSATGERSRPKSGPRVARFRPGRFRWGCLMERSLRFPRLR